MPRPRKNPAPKAPQAAKPAAPKFDLAIDWTKLEVLDLLTFSRMESAPQMSANEQNTLMISLIPMLDRLIVGGIAGYKLDQFGDLIASFAHALKERGSPNA